MAEGKPARRWRKWLMVGLTIAAALPLCAIVVLQLIFATHEIPNDQLKTPANMLRIKPAGTPLRVAIHPPGQLNTPYEEYLEASQQAYIAIAKAKNPNSEALRIYEKWRRFVNDFAAHVFSDLFGQWRANQPLTEKQTKWLLEHQDFIKDMVRMAKAGGLPSVTCEEAAAMTDEDIAKIGRCNALGHHYTLVYIFAAESRRLRDAGDPAGAADMIIAINPLAESVGEPFAGSQIAELAFKSIGLGAIENWMNTSMPPEIAKKLRDDVAGWRPIDLRRGWEITYRAERYDAVTLLNHSAWEIFQIQTGSRGIYEMMAGFTESPLSSFQNYGNAITSSIALKSSADTSIKDLDRFYRNIIEHSGPGVDLDWPDQMLSDLRARKYSGYVMQSVPNLDTSLRMATFQSRVNMDLMALEQIANGTAVATSSDPFNHGQPFKRIDEPDATVIYSVGPNRKDDGGTVSYDPTNGTNSAGDIVVRVPKRK